MQLREANASDFDALMALYGQLHPADSVSIDGRESRVFSQILQASNLHLFVLEEGGAMIATCYLNVVPNLTRSGSPYGIVENVVVEEERRGQGFGKKILGHALDVAWAAGCYKVMLQTGSQREATRAFYRACGFGDGDKYAYVAWSPSFRRESSKE